MRGRHPGILSIGLALILCAAGRVESQPTPPVYFVVAQRHPAPGQPDDAYVLPLIDPADIAQARDIAAGIGSATIVVARVEAGADSINRNVRAIGRPLWHWHVTQLVAFDDLAAEICDGTPTMVEADVKGWMRNTGGVVCFWDYTVVDEKTPAAGMTWGKLKMIYR